MSSSPSLDPQISVRKKANTAPVHSNFNNSASGHGFSDRANATLLGEKAHESSAGSNNPTWVDGFLFWLDWIIKVLGVAAAVVFGIWAPLSFEASNEASSSGNETQNTLMSAVLAVETQASIAAAQQTSAAAQQSIALENLNNRMDAIGQLLILDFCKDHTVRLLLYKPLIIKRWLRMCTLGYTSLYSSYERARWGPLP